MRLRLKQTQHDWRKRKRIDRKIQFVDSLQRIELKYNIITRNGPRKPERNL